MGHFRHLFDSAISFHALARSPYAKVWSLFFRARACLETHHSRSQRSRRQLPFLFV